MLVLVLGALGKLPLSRDIGASLAILSAITRIGSDISRE